MQKSANCICRNFSRMRRTMSEPFSNAEFSETVRLALAN
jgi:hypothetical protein